MTNPKQENALEKSAKDSYTENKSFLDNFKNIFSGIFAYSSNKKDFVKFLAEQYQENMVKLGYLENPLMHQIRSSEKNLPLYYLSF